MIKINCFRVIINSISVIKSLLSFIINTSQQKTYCFLTLVVKRKKLIQNKLSTFVQQN
jgi:hypothetical protein